MKASLKFREDQKPLFRAKVPLSILGVPFQSGLAAGDSKELSLSLGTLFDSGPAFRVAYRPNDSYKPFSLVLKTGIGAFGSPIDAPMTMSAEFNLVGGSRSNSPAFFLHFKPRFGDFSIRKAQPSAEFAHRIDSKSRGGDVSSEDEGSVEVVDLPAIGGDYMAVGGGGIKLTELATRSSTSVAAVVDTALAGMELGARTVLPIRSGAVLKLRWGVRFPEDLKSLFFKQGIGFNPTAGISSRGIPLLVMNKIGIEHVARDDSKDLSKVGPGGSLRAGGDADVTDTCFAVRRQLQGLQVETEWMRQAMDDFRAEFANRGLNNSANGTGKVPPAQGGGRGGRKDGEVDHVVDEPKKAMKGAIINLVD